MAPVFLEAEGEADDQGASKDTSKNIIANWGTWGEDYNYYGLVEKNNLNQKLKTSSAKGKIANILGFVGHIWSLPLIFISH